MLCEENLVRRIVGQKWSNIQQIKKKCHVKDIRYNDELFYFHIIVANNNRLQKHVALKNANKAAEMLKKQIAQVKKAIRDAKKREKDEQAEFKKLFNEAIFRFLQEDEAVQEEVKLLPHFKTFLLKVVDE